MKNGQLALFALEDAPAEPPAMPAGFRYAPDLIDVAVRSPFMSGRNVWMLFPPEIIEDATA